MDHGLFDPSKMITYMSKMGYFGSKTQTPDLAISGFRGIEGPWIHDPGGPKLDQSGGQSTTHMNLSTCKRMGPTA